MNDISKTALDRMLASTIRPVPEVLYHQLGHLRNTMAPARSLHDRLLVTDLVTAWVVGQSFKDLAKRAHSSLVKMELDSGALKIQAHLSMWTSAKKMA